MLMAMAPRNAIRWMAFAATIFAFPLVTGPAPAETPPNGGSLRRSFSMIFISHDLAVIRNICDRVAVMFLGRIVEVGNTEDVFERLHRPCTRALQGSVLPDEDVLSGELPSLLDPPGGCRFQTRCHRATTQYASEAPPWTPSESGDLTACHHLVGDA